VEMDVFPGRGVRKRHASGFGNPNPTARKNIRVIRAIRAKKISLSFLGDDTRFAHLELEAFCFAIRILTFYEFIILTFFLGRLVHSSGY